MMDDEVVDRAQSSKLLAVEAVVWELENSSSHDWYSSSSSPCCLNDSRLILL